jgi:hypothetical protein
MASRLAGLLFLCLVALASVASIHPPAPVPRDAPPAEFSAERAYDHLTAIAAHPHPTGSQAHAEVRDYLVHELGALGLTVSIEERQAAARVVGMVWSARVKNVVARLRGAERKGPAVMLAAHYDSVPQSRGASDDGFGVITLLETARALRAGPPVANDVLFVFTDGEELALRGAQAAIEDPELLRDVGVVLNFEARGTGGAVAMFETSDEAGGLVRALGSEAPFPTASSFVTALAAALPNGTDSLVWKRAGLPVLGFAFADGLQHYHRFTDDPEHIDRGSIQHGGAYALALARRFGNGAVPPHSADVVYFDLFGRVLVRTSTGFARASAGLTLLFFGALVVAGVRRGRLSGWGLAKGAGVWLAMVVLAPAVVALAHLAVSRNLDFYMLVARAKVFTWAAILLGSAVILAVTSLAVRRNDPRSIAVGAMLPWATGLAATAIVAPTLMAPLEWPLLFASVGMALADRNGFALYLGLAPAVVVLSNLLYAVFVAAGAMMPFAPVLFLALLGTLLVPVLAELPARARVAGAGAAVVLSIVVAFIGYRSSHYSEHEPMTDYLVYTLDHDDGEARWVAWWVADAWVARRIPYAAKRGPLPGFTRSNDLMTQAPAPRLDLAPAEVTARADAVGGDERRLVVHVASPRHARCVQLWDAGGAKVEFSPEIDGAPVRDFYRISPEADEDGMRRMSGDQSFRVWRMIHCGIPESGIDVTLTAKAGEPIKLRVVEESEGLPEMPDGPMPPRPRGILPAEGSDVTLVGRTVTL